MTKILVLLLGLLGCHGLPEVEISRGKRLYKGYQVLRSMPGSDFERSALLMLDQSVDFWSEVGPHSEQVDLMVEPSQIARVTAYLRNSGIDYQVMISDLQADIDQENEPDFNSTIGLPQTRRDKRQNGKRQRGRRGHNKEQRRQLREKLLLKKITCNIKNHQVDPGKPLGAPGARPSSATAVSETTWTQETTGISLPASARSGRRQQLFFFHSL